MFALQVYQCLPFKSGCSVKYIYIIILSSWYTDHSSLYNIVLCQRQRELKWHFHKFHHLCSLSPNHLKGTLSTFILYITVYLIWVSSTEHSDLIFHPFRYLMPFPWHFNPFPFKVMLIVKGLSTHSWFSVFLLSILPFSCPFSLHFVDCFGETFWFSSYVLNTSSTGFSFVITMAFIHKSL